MAPHWVANSAFAILVQWLVLLSHRKRIPGSQSRDMDVGLTGDSYWATCVTESINDSPSASLCWPWSSAGCTVPFGQ